MQRHTVAALGSTRSESVIGYLESEKHYQDAEQTHLNGMVGVTISGVKGIEALQEADAEQRKELQVELMISSPVEVEQHRHTQKKNPDSFSILATQICIVPTNLQDIFKHYGSS